MLRLLLPARSSASSAFFVLAAAELAVPLWAERARMTPWHPHHIAERYGLFTIIVLGECVLAASVAVQVVVDDTGWRRAACCSWAAAGLVLLFALWWLYFLKEAGDGLERRRDLRFLWGYGHYAVFAALAALGAGLEVTVEAVSHQVAASDGGVALSVVGPVAVFLVVRLAAARAAGRGLPSRRAAGAASRWPPCWRSRCSVPLGLPLQWVPLLVAVPPAVLVATRLGGSARSAGRVARASWRTARARASAPSGRDVVRDDPVRRVTRRHRSGSVPCQHRCRAVRRRPLAVGRPVLVRSTAEVRRGPAPAAQQPHGRRSSAPRRRSAIAARSAAPARGSARRPRPWRRRTAGQLPSSAGQPTLGALVERAVVGVAAQVVAEGEHPVDLDASRCRTRAGSPSGRCA